jgi:hypothetical protein
VIPRPIRDIATRPITNGHKAHVHASSTPPHF